MAEDDKPTPHQLWTEAGGGTPAYRPELYRELLIEHGHLQLVKKGAPPLERGRRAFLLWSDAGGDPAKFLELINADGLRLRTKRGISPYDALTDLRTFAELSTMETVGEHGNWHEAIDHKRGSISRGVVCNRESRIIFPTCAFCHTAESGERQCDWPTGNTCPKCDGKKVSEDTWHFMPKLVQVFPCYDCNGTGIRTCSKPVCLACVRSKDGLDYCPPHRERAGLPRTPPPDTLFEL